MTGKSGLAKQIGSHLRLNGATVFAFNPTGERGYTRQDDFGCAAAEYESDNPDEFIAAVTAWLEEKPNENLFVIVDEAHELFTRVASIHSWLGTKGRHYGITIIAITQRGAIISPTFRTQCSKIYVFACSGTDAKFLSDEYGRKEFISATHLEPLKYYCTDGFTVDEGSL